MKIKIKKAVVAEKAEVLNELDFVGGFKNFIKNPIKTTSNIAKGIAQIGITGKETTILGGEEVFDIEKRNQLRSSAESELEKVLTDIDDQIGQDRFISIKNKLDSDKFPNQENEADFNKSVEDLKKVYNIIVEAHSQGRTPTDVANAYIAALRDIVIYYQDFKIADKYLYVSSDPKLFEAEEGAVSKSFVTAYAKKLPLIAAGTGAALLGLGLAANSQQFLDLLESLKDVKKVSQAAQVVTDQIQVKDGEGITQVAQRLTGVDLGASTSVDALKDPKVKAVFQLMKMALQNKQGGSAAIDKILSGNFGSAKNLGQLFQGNLEGTGKKIGDLLVVDKGNFQNVITKQIETETKNPNVATKFLEMAGKLFGSAMAIKFAVALIGGGLTMTALRTKGERSSRMATLKALVDSFKDLTAKVSVVPQEVEPSKQAALVGKQELPALAGKTQQPALAAKPEQPALTGKPEQPALAAKPEQPALPTQPKLALPSGGEPGEKQGPERVIPVGPSSMQGKNVESLLGKLKTDLDGSEELKNLSAENEKLGKAIKTMVQIAINDITKQLQDAGYEPGDEVTISEAKTISISFFDKFAKDLTAKARKTGGATAGMQTILAVVRNWAEGAGFSVDPSALEKFGKKDTSIGAMAKTGKGEPAAQPAAKQSPEEENVVEPENIAVAKTPVDQGKAKKVGTSLKKALGNKVTVKTSKSPKGQVVITEPPLKNKEVKDAKKSAKNLGADASKISATEKSAIIAPSTQDGVKKVQKPEDAAAAINKLEKGKETSKEAPVDKIQTMKAVNSLQDLLNSFVENEKISEEAFDSIISYFQKSKSRSLEDLLDEVGEARIDKQERVELKDAIKKWYKEFTAEDLKESFDFKNRFMKLAGILRG